jgi:hypothetical protein
MARRRIEEKRVNSRSGRNLVTSRTSPEIITQQSSLVLCLATSSTVYDFLPSFLEAGGPSDSLRRVSVSILSEQKERKEKIRSAPSVR